MSERKGIMANGQLPERATSAERIAHMQEDVQDVTAKLRRTLTDKALSMSTENWVLDEDSWEIAMNGRSIVLIAKIERP